MKVLAEQVERFQEWATRRTGRSGEWETDYPEWAALWATANQALAKNSLGESEIALLLYVLVRDNESELILEMLLEYPDNGMHLARACLGNSEPEARWQIAIFLGSQEGEAAQELLRGLVQDEDEYVRRRALLASVPRDPKFAETTAESWLSAEGEYSRLAALSVLQDLRSPALRQAASRLRGDPSPHVRTKVAEIEEGAS